VKIGAVAESLGIDAATIRFYEAEHIVPSPNRTGNGYRDYNPDDINRLRFVVLGRSLGLPLDDIREILGLRDRGEAPCQYVRSVIDRQAHAIDQRISDLETMAAELRRLQGVARSLPDAADDDPRICHILSS